MWHGVGRGNLGATGDKSHWANPLPLRSQSYSCSAENGNVVRGVHKGIMHRNMLSEVSGAVSDPKTDGIRKIFE